MESTRGYFVAAVFLLLCFILFCLIRYIVEYIRYKRCIRHERDEYFKQVLTSVSVDVRNIKTKVDASIQSSTEKIEEISKSISDLTELLLSEPHRCVNESLTIYMDNFWKGTQKCQPYTPLAAALYFYMLQESKDKGFVDESRLFFQLSKSTILQGVSKSKYDSAIQELIDCGMIFEQEYKVFPNLQTITIPVFVLTKGVEPFMFPIIDKILSDRQEITVVKPLSEEEISRRYGTKFKEE